MLIGHPFSYIAVSKVCGFVRVRNRRWRVAKWLLFSYALR
ncbi:hypothetical protein HMPREF0971_02977 [Segatella oris F0302]|uniref:Uncharacterized protein n=1 Tax=Segatella oris F0302 TaxID=649760 RepID=D1QVK0_9BACT|nr:hypothetical protein HMPREF0971_02977 [Segatella oris F0302]